MSYIHRLQIRITHTEVTHIKLLYFIHQQFLIILSKYLPTTFQLLDSDVKLLLPIAEVWQNISSQDKHSRGALGVQISTEAN